VTIRRERKLPRRHPISTYDFEWDEHDAGKNRRSLVLTFAGAYDERGFRAYGSAAEFLRGELITPNSGRRYYAHFGGASDMVFLLRELAKLPDVYEVKGAFSSSSAIYVRVLDTSTDRVWTFIDSFWTMRASLKDIGEWMGEKDLQKGDLQAARANRKLLAEYNEQDCRILWHAMTRFQESILAEGGELGITAASTAMNTFLRRFLRRPIKNREALDNVARPAYTASRVEVIREECERARYYDINSSFPYSMTFANPGGAELFSVNRLPKNPENELWIAKVDVRVPESEYLPALPLRTKGGRVFFPTGWMTTSITSEDFLAGGFEIEKVHSCTTFEKRDDLKAFAERFYQLRKTGSLEGKAYKIVLNSLYGKFAERDEKDVLLIRPHRRNPDTQWMICPGVYLEKIRRAVPHSHVPMSAMITARSRRLLLEHLRDANANHDPVYYCDTDSIVCEAELPTGTELGDLKLMREVGGVNYQPQTRVLSKKLSFSTRAKRCHLPGGDSRPWDTGELQRE
jgi:hypothetical protein